MDAPQSVLSPRAALRGFYFVFLASLGVYLPYFPAWLRARGFSGLEMSLIIALTPAMTIIAPPCIGVIADLFSLRGTLLRWLSIASWIAFSALALHSMQADYTTFPFVFGSVLCFALFRSPIGMLADVITLEEGSSYGRTRLWGSLGFLVTALIAGRLLPSPGSYWVPLSTWLLLTFTVLASFVVPAKGTLPPSPAADDAKWLIRGRPFQFLLLSAFFTQASHSAYDLCCGLLFQDLGGGSFFVGVAWGIAVAAEIAMLFYSPVLLSHSSALKLRGLAFAGTVVRWLLMATVKSLPVLLVLQTLHGISFALMWASSIALVKELSSARTLGTAQGLFVASAAGGSVVGMLIWGPLYRASGGTLVFVCAALAAAIALLINTFTPVSNLGHSTPSRNGPLS
ncbi:MAG TPA: MFS transporter [Polyangiaceae bacterium]|nr:MFS transporter [Polyangiaceae bacterium]